MMRTKATVCRLVLVCASALLLVSAYHRAGSPATMAHTAKIFLNSLTDQAKTVATFDFKDDERQNWFFTPVPRKGLALREMSQEQQNLAAALLNASLSQTGFIKATSIMSLEEILRLIENSSRERRNPGKYHYSVFGEPSEKGVWGYRIEGHHLSLNYTLVNGKVATSPTFFGANPAKVPSGPMAGLRVLADEEDFARDLYKSLDESQRKTALVAEKAYNDILTSNQRKAAIEGQPSGLSASKMNKAQKDKLSTLLAVYAENLPAALAKARMDQVKAAGDNILFAWAGGPNPGDPHYYRIQAPSFLVEYDNTQNDANHIHSVWRDFNGDFGLDLLGEHYKTSHSGR
jgi:hypothetical protein